MGRKPHVATSKRQPPRRVLEPSAAELHLPQIHKSDATYASNRTRLSHLFAKATAVQVEQSYRGGAQRVDLSETDRLLISSVLRSDEEAVIDV
jgi:hypothetical protein